MNTTVYNIYYLSTSHKIYVDIDCKKIMELLDWNDGTVQAFVSVQLIHK